MFSLILNKLFYGGVVLVFVVIIISSIIYAAPVDPARLTFGQQMSESSLELKKKQLGLDQPLNVQLLRYLRDVSPIFLGRDTNWKERYNGLFMSIYGYRLGVKVPYLRESFQSGRSVFNLLYDAFPLTLILAISALTLASCIGIVLGFVAATNMGTWIDRLIIGFSTIGYSVPSYVTAIVLGVMFGYYFNNFLGLNIQGSLFEIDNLGNDVVVWKNLILPTIALGIRPIAIIAQLMRSAVIDVMNEKFILTARAKGVKTSRLLYQHVLFNALNPVITALSGWFAALLAGAFFVEYIFNFKGLGFLTVNALLNYDIPVIIGALLLTSSLFILINIAVDLIYKLIDPRVS